MYNWYIIAMKTKSEKTIYLKEGKGNNLEWTFDKNEGIWFEFKEQAEKLAKKYFKDFDNWFIEEFEYIY